jgi:serine/threonine protein kinase
MLQLCEALGEAHRYGLVHRDIKPANLIVVEQPAGDLAIKLVDFGLAKSLKLQSEESLTDSGILVGSPSYMSPEQVRGARVTVKSDIWSVGVVLYELLSGRRPFDGDGASAILAAIVADPPTPLHEVAERFPARVHAIVERCLCKAPAERFGSVEELASELRVALAELDGGEQVVRGPADEPSATISSQAPPASGEPRGVTPAARRRRRPLIAVSSSGLVLAIGLWWHSSSGGGGQDGDADEAAAGSLPKVESRAAEAPSRMLYGGPQHPGVGSAQVPSPQAETRPVQVEAHPAQQGSKHLVAKARSSLPTGNQARAVTSASGAPFLFEEPDF